MLMMSPDRYDGLHPNASPDVRTLARGHGENAARPWHRHRLAESKGKEISAFVEHYNHVRYHESLSNLTPADVYFGRADTILAERERIKRATIATRRLQHQLQAA